MDRGGNDNEPGERTGPAIVPRGCSGNVTVTRAAETPVMCRGSQHYQNRVRGNSGTGTVPKDRGDTGTMPRELIVTGNVPSDRNGNGNVPRYNTGKVIVPWDRTGYSTVPRQHTGNCAVPRVRSRIGTVIRDRINKYNVPREKTGRETRAQGPRRQCYRVQGKHW